MNKVSNTHNTTLLYSNTKERESNLELLRIIAMLAIIAHHYVVNSTVTKHFVYDGHATLQQYFLEAWGMWGKTGINAFILISGYFMCRMQLTIKRYVKLLIQVLFYSIAIMLIFALCDYQAISTKMVVNNIFRLFSNINNGFTASFMAFYAFIPFFNKLIGAISKKQFLSLILGLLFVMTICSTFFLAPTMNEPMWYMTLYFVAAYIRIYPDKYTDSLKISTTIFTVSFLTSIAVCISLVWLSNHTGRVGFAVFRWHLVADSNKFLAFVIGLSAFLMAKNLHIRHNKTINSLATGCFGVLLIHASSDTMRRWLWQDVCDVPKMFHGDFLPLIAQAIAVPAIVFLICTFIDHYYKKFLEPFFMNLVFRKKKPGHA